ncbi:MAG: DUF3516 domain-containing protein [Verrucomicrobiota bacterium]|nr:DUF3516 domain-containing protein [Verrucomicrobiota bacterium]
MSNKAPDSETLPSTTPAVRPLAPLPVGASTEDMLFAFLDYVTAKKINLYPAQERAILELLEGNNVILKTPTGSGKSLVAAAMHFKSLSMGRRSVYTCPIKALVNEKFLSLCRDFGPELVGMSTGDASVNREAPILCCTAEVLSNMALSEGANAPVHDVIMDEFHYYSDRDRGVAWQIPLLTLPQARFLLLSATLGETSFFEKEITRLTGAPTVTVASTDRPVPLYFNYTEEAIEEVVQELSEKRRTPAYLVHFSQRSATDTAQNLMSIDFCTKAEKETLARHLVGVDFSSPFGNDMKKYLRHGIGVHHAGLLPKYRILVEKLAQQNLLKFICGTDTLGVGVNVPIRTVVFTGLTKYDGEKQRVLPVRDFHQIAGRAGRKGFDDEGHVLAMAPAHVIENRKMEKKAKENPAKAKKLVKQKPPEKGYVHWEEGTFRKLIDSQPEPLVSAFRVEHGMLLNVLGRMGDGCRAMRALIDDSHETAGAKKQHRKRAFALFRSLVEKQIIELLPRRDELGRKVRVNIDLQQDFSLNQTLSLYLVDTVQTLDRDDPEYAFKVLALVESVLENPDTIIRKQIDKLKDELMREMKAADVPYEERIARLELVERYKPYPEFIYESFNAFAAKHPWVGEENIQPKSIGLAMYERYQSFADYVRELGLQRAEGVLLRHLSSVYKTLTQSVPEASRTEEIEGMIVYFEEMVRGVDSSILDEWEAIKNPAYRPDVAAAPVPTPRPPRPLDPKRDRATLERLIRHSVFQFLRPLASGDYRSAAAQLAIIAGRPPEDAQFTPFAQRPDAVINEGRGLFAWHGDTLEKAMKPYFDAHKALRLDPAARNARNTLLEQDPLTGEWIIEQTLVDPEETNDYALRFTLNIEATRNSGEPRMELVEVKLLG